MAIDWASEDFTRLYKRDTDDDLLLSWEAEAVWHKFLKKCDKSGLLETRRGARGLAALLRIPPDVIDRVLPELLEDGRIRTLDGRGFVAPNYVVANYVARSQNARKAHSRLTQRVLTGSIDQTGSQGAAEVDSEGSEDTYANSESQDVTVSHARSQNRQSPNQSINQSPTSARSRGRCAIPSDWSPRERERSLARELGLDLEAEAQEFLTYWQGDGRAKADWDLAFAARLHQQGKRRSSQASGSSELREMDDL